MKTIHKFQLRVGENFIDMALIKPLTVQMQRGTPTLWCIVDDAEDAPRPVHEVHLIGTGHRVPDGELDYLGTVQAESGFVWHAFLAKAVS